MKNHIILTLIALVLIITFSLLRQVWSGFSYFAIVCLVGICIYWIVIIILDYVYEYKTKLLDKFKFYCAKLVNSTKLTSQENEEKKAFYIKKFKKTLWKEKLIEWAKVGFLLTIIIFSIIAIVKGDII